MEASGDRRGLLFLALLAMTNGAFDLLVMGSAYRYQALR